MIKMMYFHYLSIQCWLCRVHSALSCWWVLDTMQYPTPPASASISSADADKCSHFLHHLESTIRRYDLKFIITRLIYLLGEKTFLDIYYYSLFAELYNLYPKRHVQPLTSKSNKAAKHSRRPVVHGEIWSLYMILLQLNVWKFTCPAYTVSNLSVNIPA